MSDTEDPQAPGMQEPQTPVDFAKLYYETHSDKKPDLGDLIIWFSKMFEVAHQHGYAEGYQAPIQFTFGITQGQDKVVFIRTAQMPDGQLGMIGNPTDVTPMFFNAMTQLFEFGERQPVYQDGKVQFYVQLTRPLGDLPVDPNHLEPVPEFKAPERKGTNVIPFALPPSDPNDGSDAGG